MRSPVSASASSRWRSGIAQLLHDRGHILRLDRLAIAVVDHYDGAPAAAAGALDRAQGDLAVLGRLARADAELGPERLEHPPRPDERARDVRADLDQVPADGRQVEHVVERRHRLAV